MNIGDTFGFSALPPRVGREVASIYGHHRTPWFEGVLDEIGELLRPALGGRFTPLFFTCTSSGGREATVANLVRPSDRVLTVGPSFGRLARTWGARVQGLSSAAVVGPSAHDSVFIEHVLPDGALVDVQAIVQAVRSAGPDTPIVLDASVSFGSDFWDAQGYDVDALLVVPERALMGIPGVAILAVGEKLIETVTRRRAELQEAPFLYDILRYWRAASRHTTPYSPNISACVALHAALREILSAGGLGEHQADQARRATSIRDRLVDYGFRQMGAGIATTNAFTSFELPDGVGMDEALNVFQHAQVGVRSLDSRPPVLQLAHAGYMPDEQVQRLYAVGAALLRSKERVRKGSADRGSQQQGVGPAIRRPVEAPFTIPASEFSAQARQHARKMPADRVAAANVAEAASRVFCDRHVVHEEALRHRRVGFVGAGRIARKAVELCLARGITNMTVYSPALAAAKTATDLTPEQRQRQDEWQGLPVTMASTLDEVFMTSHVVVLLPVVYDEQALRLFRKGPEYRNERLVDGELLAKAERAGHLDLIINAAARGALIDRPPLTRAVRAGWLRYYSDETPAAGDPLLACDGAWFTAHVGGSCAAPQAAVARNTHRILHHALAQLHGAPPPARESDERPPNVVNAHLLAGRAAARVARAAASSSSTTIRVLLSDPFDVESLSFDRLREAGAALEVHDVSAERLSPAALAEKMRAIRPHILMLRSRTTIDDVVASSIVESPIVRFVEAWTC
jgi:aspartate aminotransferase-like enzyme/phosphoglycerate dehydrogenase-like enzyme